MIPPAACMVSSYAFLKTEGVWDWLVVVVRLVFVVELRGGREGLEESEKSVNVVLVVFVRSGLWYTSESIYGDGIGISRERPGRGGRIGRASPTTSSSYSIISALDTSRIGIS
jgi:hypothetical protein